MEETRDQLADALYQKGLALAEIESLKVHYLPLHFFFLYLNVKFPFKLKLYTHAINCYNLETGFCTRLFNNLLCYV
jgi:hypothetical protein